MFIRVSIKQLENDEWNDIILSEMTEDVIRKFISYAGEATKISIKEQVTASIIEQAQATIEEAQLPVQNMIDALDAVLGE